MSKPGENISKRKDGRWEARYIKGRREDGKIIFGYVYGKSYHEAREKKNAVLGNIGETENGVDDSCRFGTLLDTFLIKKKTAVKESTYSHYCEIVNNHIRPLLGELPVGGITGRIIDRFTGEKLESGRLDGGGGLSAKNVRDILSVIKMTLDIALEDEIITRKISFAKPRLKAKTIDILSPEEQNLILELASSGDLREFGYYLCLQTGLRIGEICALRWNDIDFENRLMRVDRTLIRISDTGGTDKKTKVIFDSPKTQSSSRVIPLPDVLIRELAFRKSCAMSGDSFLLTGTDAYIEPRLYTYNFKQFLDKNHMKHYGFHALRHTFATRCIENGFDAKSLSELLGHANVKITLERYVHPSLDLKREHMRRLSESFAP